MQIGQAGAQNQKRVSCPARSAPLIVPPPMRVASQSRIAGVLVGDVVTGDVVTGEVVTGDVVARADVAGAVVPVLSPQAAAVLARPMIIAVIGVVVGFRRTP